MGGSRKMSSESKTTYTLEMLKSSELRAKYADCPGLRIERMEIKCPEFNKFLHTVVGYEYRWGGRTDWNEDDWYRYVNRDKMETWLKLCTPEGGRKTSECASRR